MSSVPIIIICYNNYKYVDNTIKQLDKININYHKNIIILNNCSTCPETIEYLNNIDVSIIHNPSNRGPQIDDGGLNNDIYQFLPDKYILTDADLQFHPDIPSNFIEILENLQEEFPNSHKIGFALDISDFHNMYQYDDYCCDKNIYDWEKQFWKHKYIHNDYELYLNNDIDTTFAIINKLTPYKHNTFIRVAGNFTAKHLPWYINNPLFNLYENYMMYKDLSNHSTIRTFIKRHIIDNYLEIYKNNELILIDKNDSNLSFWQNHYPSWEIDTFQIFDAFLHKDKIFIDIGAWIGTTSIYGCRKSKHVYVIDANNFSIQDLNKNMSNNCPNNYTIIHKAIYNINDTNIIFGKNKFLTNSKLNDSTSQIYLNNDNSNDSYSIQTIDLSHLIQDYNINTYDISLIKVDIEGGEEFILNDLYHLYSTYHIPLYISFHYDWWNNKDLDRFTFLSQEHKNNIISYPFSSMLFV